MLAKVVEMDHFFQPNNFEYTNVKVMRKISVKFWMRVANGWTEKAFWLIKHFLFALQNIFISCRLGWLFIPWRVSLVECLPMSLWSCRPKRICLTSLKWKIQMKKKKSSLANEKHSSSLNLMFSFTSFDLIFRHWPWNIWLLNWDKTIRLKNRDKAVFLANLL